MAPASDATTASVVVALTMAEIALLGTSADPPTCGHQALLEGLLLHFSRVATWASDNPMKRHDADLPQRHELLRALVTAIADSRLELAQDLSSPFAITTLERARRRWRRGAGQDAVCASWSAVIGPARSLGGSSADSG